MCSLNQVAVELAELHTILKGILYTGLFRED